MDNDRVHELVEELSIEDGMKVRQVIVNLLSLTVLLTQATFQLQNLPECLRESTELSLDLLDRLGEEGYPDDTTNKAFRSSITIMRMELGMIKYDA